MRIYSNLCIRKTSLSSQTDTKRAVMVASIFLSLSCLIACKDRQSFSLILQMCQCFTTQFRFRGCYRDKRHLKSSIQVLT